MGARNESRANPAERAERQVAAYELVLRGHSLRSAAAEMKRLGYQRVSYETVRDLVALEGKQRVEPLAEEWRTMLIERLNASRLHVMNVLEREHLTISDGRVVSLEDEFGKDVPIVDDGPVLQAVDRLNKIDAQIAKLTGAEAPVQTEANVTATIARPVELEAAVARARQAMEEEESRLREGPA